MSWTRIRHNPLIDEHKDEQSRWGTKEITENIHNIRKTNEQR